MATIHTQSSDGGKTLTIQIEGKFEFSTHHDFSKAYKAQAETGIKYRIELSKTEYMDSAALGMLLMIKAHAETNRGTVILHHPTPEVSKLLEVANFHKLFTIEK